MGTNSPGNVTDISSQPEPLEETNKSYKIVMTITSITLLLFTIVTTVAMRRTKSTPETARFLSSGLMVFDITCTISFTLRRFIAHRNLNVFVQVLGVNSLFVAYVTVCIMSLERFIIFSFPHFYLRHMPATTVKRIVSGIWITLIAFAFFVRYGMCYAIYPDAKMDDVIGRCNTVSFIFYGSSLVLNCFISSACYIRILLVEKKGNKLRKENRTMVAFCALMKYKTTGIVFLYMVSIYFTTISYSIIMPLYRANMYAGRISLEIVNMSSCILDPFLYVLWFRECRYEIFKMFDCISPKLAGNIDKMRMEIFNIVVVDSEGAHTQDSNTIDSRRTYLP